MTVNFLNLLLVSLPFFILAIDQKLPNSDDSSRDNIENSVLTGNTGGEANTQGLNNNIESGRIDPREPIELSVDSQKYRENLESDLHSGSRNVDSIRQNHPDIRSDRQSNEYNDQNIGHARENLQHKDQSGNIEENVLPPVYPDSLNDNRPIHSQTTRSVVSPPARSNDRIPHSSNIDGGNEIPQQPRHDASEYDHIAEPDQERLNRRQVPQESVHRNSGQPNTQHTDSHQNDRVNMQNNLAQSLRPDHVSREPINRNQPISNDAVHSGQPPRQASAQSEHRRMDDESRYPNDIDREHRIPQHSPNQATINQKHNPQILNGDRNGPGRRNVERADSRQFAPDPYDAYAQQQRPPIGQPQIPHGSHINNRNAHPDGLYQLPSVDSERNTLLPGNDFVSLVIILFPAVKQCIYYTPVSDFIIDYQVIYGGMLDVGILVRDPDGQPIVVRPPSADVSLPIKVPPHFNMRPYGLCLDNRKASYAEKHVALTIDVNINWENPSPQERALIDYIQKRSFGGANLTAMDEQFTEGTNAITTVLEGLFVRLRHIQSLQKKTDNFATIDKSLMESNLDRVLRGSLFQILMLLAVCGVQILLIRALFDPNSRLYRLWWGRRSCISARC